MRFDEKKVIFRSIYPISKQLINKICLLKLYPDIHRTSRHCTKKVFHSIKYWIWSHLLKKSLMENFIFKVVSWKTTSQRFWYSERPTRFLLGIIHLVRTQNFSKKFFGKFCIRTKECFLAKFQVTWASELHVTNINIKFF